MTNKTILFFTILITFLLPAISVNEAHGQLKTAGSIDINDTINITTAPPFPKANEEVSVRIENFSYDLNSSEIIWALDGIIKEKGVGKKNFSFRTGKIGSVSLIKIIVKTKDGKNMEKSLVVRPAGVDMFWQADSYTPPFYKGKALYSYQSTITVVAIPNIVNSNGEKINPSSLIYKWTKDSKVLGEVSGYGKNYFSFTKSILSNSPEIEVEVMSSDKKIKASGSIVLDPIETKVLMYENNPLYGIIYDKAVVDKFTMSNNEITLVAVPYFFSTEEASRQKLKYDWSMNGQNINNQQSKRQATFRNTGGNKGSARISVSLQNENDGKELQSARTDVLLDFEGDEGGGGSKTVSF